jgi:XTP/dITP diphosphohydrolase
MPNTLNISPINPAIAEKMEAPLKAIFQQQQVIVSPQLPAIEQVLAVVAQLRNPQGGCPWDLKQTHASLRPHLLEEAYEAVETMTIDPLNDVNHLKEELGDVLLQVLLHAQIAQDNGLFSFADVCDTLAEKLVHRHPHVFRPEAQAENKINTPEQVSAQWQAIKQAEKAKKPANSRDASSVLSTVSVGQPALSRAAKISRKAVKLGFKWPNLESLWDCVMSEFDEFKVEAIAQSPIVDRMEDELGDIFFACASLAQFFELDPEVALTRATNKFQARFWYIEQHTTKPLTELTFDEWETLWGEAKIFLATSAGNH